MDSEIVERNPDRIEPNRYILLVEIRSKLLNTRGITNALESQASRDDLNHTDIRVLYSIPLK